MKLVEIIEEREEFARKMEWLIIARFILYGLAMIIAVVRDAVGVCPANQALTCTNLSILVLNLIYLLLTKRRLYLYAGAYVSLIVDLLFVTLAVHLQGGLASSIFPLNYLIIILVASILISRRAGIVITTLSSIAVAVLISLEYLNILPPISVKDIGRVMYQDKGYVVTTVTARIIFFYAVAMVSGYLSDKIRMQTRELREKEERLIHAERMAMAARIAGETSHEIKNPLAVIKSGLYLLRKILPENEKAQITISQMDNATGRVVAYIDNLLNFSRPPVLVLKSVDVYRVIGDALSELSNEVAGIEIVKNFSSDVLMLNADPDKLKQVFIHIIKNAAEAIGDGTGRISIGSEREEDFVRISISNTGGRGIAEEDLQHIFDPLFTTKGKGMGLGLAVCQRIIEAHKGTIEVKSRVGEGTVFVIKLPGIESC